MPVVITELQKYMQDYEPRVLKERSGDRENEMEVEECSVCLEEFQSGVQVVILPCHTHIDLKLAEGEENLEAAVPRNID